MTNLLQRKLEAFAPLPEDDQRFLDAVMSQPRQVPADCDLILEGSAPRVVHVIVDGFACRYKRLPGGRRQIVAFLVPGDFCDLHVFILKSMDHSIGTLSPVTLVEIPRARVIEMTDRPTIARALWWATLVDEAILREWILNIGQRDAETRIAHLLCEIHVRLQVVGLADGGRFAFPVTQAEIGDALGISAVHVNRSLQALRAEGLLTIDRRAVVIEDPARMRQFAAFNPNYLHLTGGKSDD